MFIFSLYTIHLKYEKKLFVLISAFNFRINCENKYTSSSEKTL